MPLNLHLPKRRLPHSVQPLNEGPYRGKRLFRRKSGHRYAGIPGPWAVQTEREFIDTGFEVKKCDKDLAWAERDVYYRQLQEE
jgi:hypothetical protein